MAIAHVGNLSIFLGAEPSQIPGLEVVIVLAIILQFLQKMKQDGMLEEALYYKFRREVSGAAGVCGCLIFPKSLGLIDCRNLVSSQLFMVSQTFFRSFVHGRAHSPRRDQWFR